MKHRLRTRLTAHLCYTIVFQVLYHCTWSHNARQKTVTIDSCLPCILVKTCLGFVLRMKLLDGFFCRCWGLLCNVLFTMKKYCFHCKTTESIFPRCICSWNCCTSFCSIRGNQASRPCSFFFLYFCFLIFSLALIHVWPCLCQF